MKSQAVLGSQLAGPFFSDNPSIQIEKISFLDAHHEKNFSRENSNDRGNHQEFCYSKKLQLKAHRLMQTNKTKTTGNSRLHLSD